MTAQGSRDFLHRFQLRTHGADAPLVQELASPGRAHAPTFATPPSHRRDTSGCRAAHSKPRPQQPGPRRAGWMNQSLCTLLGDQPSRRSANSRCRSDSCVSVNLQLMRPRFLDPLSPFGEISSFTLIGDWCVGCSGECVSHEHDDRQVTDLPTTRTVSRRKISVTRFFNPHEAARIVVPLRGRWWPNRSSAA